MLVDPNPSGGMSAKRLDVSVANVCRVRALLNGLSTVDTDGLIIPDVEAIDAHLRLCEFDTDSPLDMERLRTLLAESVTYLRELHGFEFPLSIEEPETIHDVFVIASQPSTSGGETRDPELARMCLKVMHVLNHISGRQLVYTANAPESELVNRLHTKVLTTVDGLRADGVKITEWAAGQKTTASLVTKLLAKRETLASRIFDRIRYRIITETKSDLVHALSGFANRLVPFNYVVPGQSQNGILTLRRIAETLEVPLQTVESLWGERMEGEEPTPQNEFSGSTYRCVNFVADIPMRIDDLAPDAAPAIAFVQAEFQLVDAGTDSLNNQGENAHEAYKARQLAVVRKRLLGRKWTALD